MNSLTREQKLYIVAGGFGLFIISLFLKWAGTSALGIDVSAKGWDVLPSAWLWLIAAIVAGGVALAKAFRVDLPRFVDDTLALLCGFAILFLMVSFLLDGDYGHKYGFWLGLIGAVVGFAGTIMAHD